jgi:NitT/TauT family transport system substrate-binding protein
VKLKLLRPWKRLGVFTTLALVVFSLLLSACQPTATPPAGAAQPTAAEPVKLRLAMLPIIDALPFYVAQKDGLFARYGVEVEFIPAASAAERDQIIAAGQADGMINDMVSVTLYNRDAVQVQIVRFARVADANTAMYRVLAAKDSGITSPAGLAGVPIGMSQATIIDYVTSRLLEKEGLSPEQIQSIAVPKLPERMALLGSGELKAATLPEPFGTIATQGGAVIIVDDSKYPEYGNSVISFRKAVIDKHPQAISGFLRAVEEASMAINASPETYRGLLGEYKLVPENVQTTYPIPPFPAASLPSEAQFADVVAWAKAHSLIEKDQSYSDSITAAYLPK